jgi:glucokinase
VIPRFVEFFKQSGFNKALAQKGLMKDYFKDVPVWLVTAEYPGLMGAGVALDQAAANRQL